MIIQIPILNQLLILSLALIIPLFKKNRFLKIKVLGTIILTTVFCLVFNINV